jgi:hypothetical protein
MDPRSSSENPFVDVFVRGLDQNHARHFLSKCACVHTNIQSTQRMPYEHIRRRHVSGVQNRV